MKQHKRKREAAATSSSGRPSADDVELALPEPRATEVPNETVSPVSAQASEVSAMSESPDKNERPDHAQSHMYALGASCTVRDGLSLKSALLDLLGDRRPVTIDVRAVERIDTAALQVLCAFVRDRRASGGEVHWVGSTDIFFEAVRLLGLQKALGVGNDMFQGAAL